jgi:hypothetical protein
MVSTHNVNCHECGKQIAWWSMFNNIQYQDEYECSAAIDTRNNTMFMDEVHDDDESLDNLQKIIDEKQLEKMDGNTRTECNWNYCKIKNDTTFCKSCATKLKMKCPVCGGTIWLGRKR